MISQLLAASASPGNLTKYKFSDLIPGLLNQKLGKWDLVAFCVFTNSPDVMMSTKVGAPLVWKSTLLKY